jgi:hypothetical protein
LGVILFAVGALIAVILFFATLIVAKLEKRYEGSVPLVTFGLIAAAIIALYTLIEGALAFVPAFFWSLGLMELDPAYYRNLFWGFGHPAQQINLAAMVSRNCPGSPLCSTFFLSTLAQPITCLSTLVRVLPGRRSIHPMACTWPCWAV